MQEQTFESLDHALKLSGNARTASVRSDLLLHVPKALKTPWGANEDYIVFVGEQRGAIVEKEVQCNYSPPPPEAEPDRVPYS
jgi:hypothetical protein